MPAACGNVHSFKGQVSRGCPPPGWLGPASVISCASPNGCRAALALASTRDLVFGPGREKHLLDGLSPQFVRFKNTFRHEIRDALG